MGGNQVENNATLWANLQNCKISSRVEIPKLDPSSAIMLLSPARAGSLDWKLMKILMKLRSYWEKKSNIKKPECVSFFLSFILSFLSNFPKTLLYDSVRRACARQHAETLVYTKSYSSNFHKNDLRKIFHYWIKNIYLSNGILKVKATVVWNQ